jgi:hypothetical protein
MFTRGPCSSRPGFTLAMTTTHSDTALLIDWRTEAAAHWGREPLRLSHRLHESPLFSTEALVRLIERYPASSCSLVLSNQRGERQRRWREGDLRGATGAQVLEAIAQGSMWLNLRSVNAQDAGYQALIERLYAELAAELPGFEPSALKMGILISSPKVQVHYHADLPGQGLWQIAGRKRVWLYPPQPPYLSDRALEDIAYTGVEFHLPYERSFDAAAVVFDLEPGQGLAWPLNAPHRIDNHDCLNISVTTEYWTEDNRRSQQVHLANALLRRWHLPTGGRALSGPAYWAKAALQAAWWRSPWARRARRVERPIDFRLDPRRPGHVIDIPPFYR